MHLLEYKEDNFQPDSFLNYRVSIQFNLNGFSFCLKDINSGIIPFFKFHPFRLSNDTGLAKKIGQLLKEEAFLAQTFSGSEIIMNSRKFTVVPVKFFNQDHARELFEFNHGPAHESEIRHQYLINYELVIIFSIPSLLKIVLEEHLFNPGFSHILCPLLNYASVLAEKTSRFAVICFSDSGFYFLVFNDGKPIFINFFDQHHANDLTFYFLTVLQQLNMDTDGLRLFICGEVEKIPDLKIQNNRKPAIEFIARIPEDRSRKIYDHISFYKYFSLLIQS